MATFSKVKWEKFQKAELQAAAVSGEWASGSRPLSPGSGHSPGPPGAPGGSQGGCLPGGQASERHWSASTAFVVIQ